jgi:NhaA family Na+:H+ antiporter
MSTPAGDDRQPFLHRLPLPERAFLARVFRDETVGGGLLLVAAAIALVWATAAPGAYDDLRGIVPGGDLLKPLHLDLTLAKWAGDGLLAVFFLVAGLEVKREVVVGELRNPREAVLPVVSALAGMVVPAAAYLLVTVGTPGAARGWGIPMATDIAFALAVLAVVAPGVPTALRAYLLTLAVVDDIGAVLVIAVAYTSDLAWPPLLGAVAALAAYGVLQARRITTPWVLAPLALVAWALVHASGVHATVAGVAIGLLTRVRHDAGETESPAERLEHALRPYSAAIAVPLFALFAAGVPLTGDMLRGAAEDPAAIGVVLGLVVGKAVGIVGGAYVVARFTRAALAPGLGWADVFGVALVSGIGFTVSLLVTELAFAGDPERQEYVRAAVLAGSLLAALLAAIVLRARHRAHEALDDDIDAP